MVERLNHLPEATLAQSVDNLIPICNVVTHHQLIVAAFVVKAMVVPVAYPRSDLCCANANPVYVLVVQYLSNLMCSQLVLEQPQCLARGQRELLAPKQRNRVLQLGRSPRRQRLNQLLVRSTQTAIVPTRRLPCNRTVQLPQALPQRRRVVSGIIQNRSLARLSLGGTRRVQVGVARSLWVGGDFA